ncbi:MAG: alpha/beta hydrolase fold domain-containing protein [Microbacteriaceae bacterium]
MTHLSFLARLMPLAMKLRGAKRRYASAELTLAKIARDRARPSSFAPPASLEKSMAVTRRDEQGWPVFAVAPRSGSTPRRVLYLHGGANVYEIVRQHWSLVAELAVAASARIDVAIYPLAPEGTAGALVEVCADLVEAMIAEVGAEHVTIMGDSAGGGMSLATAMVLRDRGAAAVKVSLISPVLDLSITDPAVIELAKTDPWLDVLGARAASELYRGELPFTDPRVSAIHGSLDGLGAIQIFTGTNDMLHADALRLRALAAKTDHPLEWHVGEQMIHVYPLLPIPEAKPARRALAEFARS